MPLSALQQQERTVADLFEQVTPSVVQVTEFKAQTNPYTMNEVAIPKGTGSGFVWDSEGHVVTNFHVIRGADAAKVAVTDASGTSRSYDATLVGFNPDKDVAVLQIKTGEGELRPIELGESAGLRVGQTTLAIGNPFGLDHTLTVGVVSGLGREMTAPSGRPITGVIQTDAAINPGNSGGALLDSRGRLIGMNTAILSPSGSSAGIGFAVPVDTLRQQVEAIIEGRLAPRAALGITYAQGTQGRALERLVRGAVEGRVPRGVLVVGVAPGSSADAAGLQPTVRLANGGIGLGDIIVRLDGTPITKEEDLLRALDNRKPGETVKLGLARLGERPEDGAQVFTAVEISIRLQAAEVPQRVVAG